VLSIRCPCSASFTAQDGLLQFAAVAQRAPGALHVIAERGVRHLASVPHLPEQLVAGQHAVAMPDQVDEEVEHLGLHRNDLAPVDDPKLRDIDREIAHPVLLVVCQGFFSRDPAAVVKTLPNRCAPVIHEGGGADTLGHRDSSTTRENDMPTPLQILMDPISLIVLGIYGALILLEAPFPARTLPRVKGWKTRAMLVFAVCTTVPNASTPSAPSTSAPWTSSASRS
jgi:hypothetical protein